MVFSKPRQSGMNPGAIWAVHIDLSQASELIRNWELDERIKIDYLELNMKMRIYILN